MEAEKITVCDEDGVSLGVATRQEIHEKGHWHETFHCWFVSRKQGKDTIHLQLRSRDKKDFPNMFDITAAGHILSDETMEDGVREIEEELGIAVSFEALIPLGVIKDQIFRDDFIDNERCHVFLYLTEGNIDAMYRLQREEVAGIVTADFQEFYKLCSGLKKSITVEGFVADEKGRKAAIRKSIGNKDLVPHNLSYWKQITQFIQKELAQ
ncbi:isopentenyldiphosphate isomerase [Planomicrobium soli]|uniref:Isopentenyldiphosphate isomerase n=1 Tax=Planomicrobium soli TaxID=1176648 RepID=A0A2P8H212_9BACL|nr:NUDIX domain-containing protein [Planomicrobium soli]PSL40256.1 isopentenyldiphosphate isomerase [Planomicrobium soli]